jgi:hypothetical protein
MCNYDSDEDEDPFLENEDVVYDMPEADVWNGLLKHATMEYEVSKHERNKVIDQLRGVVNTLWSKKI